MPGQLSVSTVPRFFPNNSPGDSKQPKKSEKTFLYAKCKNIGKFSNLKVEMKNKYSQHL